MELQFAYNSIIFFSFLAILVKFIKKWNKAKQLDPNQNKLPPGPWKLPLIGSIHHLIRVGFPPHHVLRDLAVKHGPLFHLQLGEVQAIVVSSPRMAELVAKTHDLAFSGRPETLAFKIMCYGYKDVAFCPYGEYWRQMRKICVEELLSSANVRSFRPIRKDEVGHLVRSIQVSCGKPVNLTEKIYTYTSSIICRAAFGNICRDRETFVKLEKKMFALTGGLDLPDIFPSLKILHVLSFTKMKLLKIHHQMDRMFEDMIKAHIEKYEKENSPSDVKEEEEEEDLIDILLRVKSRAELQIPINNDCIKAIIFDMFAGGTETSFNAIEWCLSEMVRNPQVMAKAQSEIRQACKGKKSIEESDIMGLNYLKLVIKETLRLHPPIPVIPKECREDCEIEGYKIPTNTKVMVNTWAIGRDPEYWKDPDSFKPERFEDCRVDFVGNHFHYIPFGAGRRMCPGMAFAEANVELALAMLLYHFNWDLPHGVEELDMREAFGLSGSRKCKLHLVPTLYDPSQ